MLNECEWQGIFIVEAPKLLSLDYLSLKWSLTPLNFLALFFILWQLDLCGNLYECDNVYVF